MRVFVATRLHAANAGLYDAWAADLARDSRGAVRPVPAGSAHLTHAFLGEIGPDLVTAVQEDLAGLVGSLGAVPFSLAPPEILGRPSEPRLVMAAVATGGREVAEVTRRIGDLLRQRPALADLAPARHPHATLARFRKRAGRTERNAVQELLAGAAESPRPDDVLRSVEIMSSRLSPAGPVYEVIARLQTRATEPSSRP